MTFPWSKSSVIEFLKTGAIEDIKHEISKGKIIPFNI
jgi:hypothetical protein